jgi:predicted ATPase
VEITNTLDGIPLALELAAATLQRMSLAELDNLLHRLEGANWLHQVASPVRDLPERQHTLENVVAWSYTLLSEPQQVLFSRLVVFSGWIDAESAAAVCYPAPQPSAGEVRTLLDSLADHSVLVRDTLGGVACWRMLEIIREYASLQLGVELLARLEARRVGYYLARLQDMAHDPDSGRREAFFRLHANNLQACLKWAIDQGATEYGFRLAGYLEDSWYTHGYLKETLEMLKELLCLPDRSPPELRALTLEQAADMAWQQHDFEASLAFLKEAIELRRLHGLTIQSAMDFNRLGRIYIERGEYAQARRALEESLALARSDPGSLNPGSPLAQLGELALFEGRLEEAKARLSDALTYLDESENIFLAITTIDLAEVALAEQDFPRALDWLCRAHAYAHLIPRRLMVYLCTAAGYLLLAPGSDPEAAGRAARLYGAIQAIEERSGVVLSAYYRELNQRRIQIALQRLSDSEWQAEFEAGQRWTAEYALNQARLVS